MSFSLEYLRKENHLVLPRYSPYILTQNIYDLLFQYVLTPERETLLKNFMEKLEAYTKSKPDAPFSIALNDLEFLGEGWQELKMLNWSEMPVTVFTLRMPENSSEEQLDDALAELRSLMRMNYDTEKQVLYVYPRDVIW